MQSLPLSSLSSLASLSGDGAAVILRDEPADVVARVLALSAWPWEAAFLQRMSALKQRDINAHKQAWTLEYAESPSHRVVDQVLMEAMMHRAHQCPTVSPELERTASRAEPQARAWLGRLLRSRSRA